ncbi:hypothetical protein [Actinophytocola sp.]|uniref:hypothetical protein n=1 Tax=Actinophytocola sp. TaxID=1872138 RepID=UPI003D6B85E7
MKLTNSGARLLAAVVAAGAVATTAACQDGNTAAPETVTQVQTVTEDPAAADDTDTADTDAGDSDAGDSGGNDAAAASVPESWPDQDFPLPSAATVSASDGDTQAFVLHATDPNAVVAFYRDALPAAGYQITTDKGVIAGGVDIAGLRFTGHGYSGKIAIVANTVTIKLT